MSCDVLDGSIGSINNNNNNEIELTHLFSPQIVSREENMWQILVVDTQRMATATNIMFPADD